MVITSLFVSGSTGCWRDRPPYCGADLLHRVIAGCSWSIFHQEDSPALFGRIGIFLPPDHHQLRDPRTGAVPDHRGYGIVQGVSSRSRRPSVQLALGADAACARSSRSPRSPTGPGTALALALAGSCGPFMGFAGSGLRRARSFVIGIAPWSDCGTRALVQGAWRKTFPERWPAATPGRPARCTVAQLRHPMRQPARRGCRRARRRNHDRNDPPLEEASTPDALSRHGRSNERITPADSRRGRELVLDISGPTSVPIDRASASRPAAATRRRAPLPLYSVADLPREGRRGHRG